MSIVQTGNIHLESTANNRIEYAGSNTIVMYEAVNEVLRSNTSGTLDKDNTASFSLVFTFALGSTYQTTADRTTYSTETTAAVTGANLSQARYALLAI